MTMFLVLVGFALFAGAAAMSIAYAARNDPRWIAGTFFFPFVIPLYYRRHWEALHLAAMVQAAGLVMIVAGILIEQFQGAMPETLAPAAAGNLSYTPGNREQSDFVNSERALFLLVANRNSRGISGRLHGAAFKPDRVEMINGVLRLSEGDGFFPVREIAIDFSRKKMDPKGRIRRTISPASVSPPQVLVSWLDEDGRPATEIIRGRYRLDLELVPLSEGRLAGHLQITLPDAKESYASGEFVAVTNFLRYHGDEVDLHFDHEDTLRYVGQKFLESQHDATGITEVSYSSLTMDALNAQGEAVATVLLADGREAGHVLIFGKGTSGWVVQVPESLAATEAAGLVSVYRVLPAETAAHPRAPSPARTRATSVERQVMFADLADFAGRGALIEYRSGRREEGVLKGVRKDRLVIEAIKRGGVVEYHVAEKEIGAIRLVSGEVLRLAGSAPAPDTPAASPIPVASGGLDTLTTKMVAGVDVEPLVNRNVRVTARDGKITVGVLRGVNSRKRLVVETLVGGGKIDYTVPVDQVMQIESVAR